MPIRHAIWKVDFKPQLLPDVTLAKEQILEDMIVADSSVLSDQWMLIGRQEETGQGGRIDLLAIAPDGSLVLIELKRNRTPRDVVSQALDYASWIEKLTPDRIAGIYGNFAPGRSLREDFKQRFREELNEDSLNQSHQLIIVASSLDGSTERIVQYLSARDIPINVLFFQVFEYGTDQFLSRAWLIDPVETNASSSSAGASESWNGEFYVSFGDGPERAWEEARQYGFVSAGGGAWFTRTLQLLSPGDRVWVRVPGEGFVGVGRVTGPAQPAALFTVKTPECEAPALRVLTAGHYHRQHVNNPDESEYFVPVKWIETVPVTSAFSEIGLFGNQNTVCKPTTPKWRHTVDRLKERFPKWNITP
jgi:uncharacterized protein YeaO (DUF488 family)